MTVLLRITFWFVAVYFFEKKNKTFEIRYWPTTVTLEYFFLKIQNWLVVVYSVIHFNLAFLQRKFFLRDKPIMSNGIFVSFILKQQNWFCVENIFWDAVSHMLEMHTMDISGFSFDVDGECRSTSSKASCSCLAFDAFDVLCSMLLSADRFVTFARTSCTCTIGDTFIFLGFAAILPELSELLSCICKPYWSTFVILNWSVFGFSDSITRKAVNSSSCSVVSLVWNQFIMRNPINVQHYNNILPQKICSVFCSKSWQKS